MNNKVPYSNLQKKVVCIIPTLNEGYTVAKVISDAKRYSDRIIVVDGHSNDNTRAMASAAGAEVIFQKGKGKGMALRTVFSHITGDIFIIIDGDATYDAKEIGAILQPILDNKADMVIGSRLRGKLESGAISKLNIFGNHLFNFLINSLFKGKITDSQSGFRAMNKKTIQALDLRSKGFEIETEITIKALQQGLKIQEVPISYSRRRGTPSKLNSFIAGSRILKVIILS